jgi:alpha-D-ribose 1-methylphosphonate 5-triphosphate synthase subunit PhnL
MANLAQGREALSPTPRFVRGDDACGSEALGLKLYAPPPAAALTAICAPEGIDSGKIVKEFRETFDAVVANGQGEMKGKLFRIAHIGYYDYLDTVGVLAALEQVIAKLTGKKVEFGSAVRAAQEVYARLEAKLTALGENPKAGRGARHRVRILTSA